MSEGDDKPIVRYRPHHFLCSLGFEGKGYSEAFTANMAAIVMGRLRAAGGDATLIEVTPATDDICAPCPKRRGSVARPRTRSPRSMPPTPPPWASPPAFA